MLGRVKANPKWMLTFPREFSMHFQVIIHFILTTGLMLDEVVFLSINCVLKWGGSTERQGAHGSHWVKVWTRSSGSKALVLWRADRFSDKKTCDNTSSEKSQMWEWERTLELKLSQSRLCKKQLWIPSVLTVRSTQSVTGLLLEVAGLGAF